MSLVRTLAKYRYIYPEKLISLLKAVKEFFLTVLLQPTCWSAIVILLRTNFCNIVHLIYSPTETDQSLVTEYNGHKGKNIVKFLHKYSYQLAEPREQAAVPIPATLPVATTRSASNSSYSPSCHSSVCLQFQLYSPSCHSSVCLQFQLYSPSCHSSVCLQFQLYSPSCHSSVCLQFQLYSPSCHSSVCLQFQLYSPSCHSSVCLQFQLYSPSCHSSVCLQFQLYSPSCHSSICLHTSWRGDMQSL